MIVATWIAGWYLLTRWRDKDFLSISRHAASSPMTMALFAVVLIGCGAVLYWWLAFWLGPKLGLGSLYLGILAAAFVCQVVTAAVPDISGWYRKVHKLAAWTMAWLFLPMAWLVATAPVMDQPARVICVALAGYMTFGAVMGVARKIRARFLFFQASYIVALQLIILTAAYL